MRGEYEIFKSTFNVSAPLFRTMTGYDLSFFVDGMDDLSEKEAKILYVSEALVDVYASQEIIQSLTSNPNYPKYKQSYKVFMYVFWAYLFRFRNMGWMIKRIQYGNIISVMEFDEVVDFVADRHRIDKIRDRDFENGH